MADPKQRAKLKGGIMRNIIAMLAMFLLSGCATQGVTTVQSLASAGGVQEPHRVVVISMLGNDLIVETLGTVLFLNWRRDEDVSSWDIDEFVERHAEEAITQGAKFHIMETDTRETRDMAGAGSTSRHALSGNLIVEGGMETLTNLAGQYEADSVLLVSKGLVTFPKGWRGRGLYCGYCILQQSVFGLKTATNNVDLKLWLVDGTTGDVIASTSHGEFSWREKDQWVEKDEESDELDLADERGMIEELLKTAITKSLDALHMN